MEKNRIIYLYEGYRDGSSSAVEIDEFISLLSDPVVEEELKSLWGKEWESLSQADVNSTAVNRYEEIYDYILSHPQIDKNRVKVRRLWPVVAAAICMVMAIGAGIWFYHDPINAALQTDVVKNDIPPGKSKATLVLGGGETISLSDAKNGVVIDAKQLSYNDGTRIKANATSKSLIASTPRGGTYMVILQDGTKVWLNAASSIQFPSSFAGLKQRSIKLLAGEAYFEVAKDKRHPFVVISDHQEVEVLGTHFNINAYADEAAVKTTLLEGSVRVSSGKSLKAVLTPGQQASSMNGRVSVKNIDPESAVAWKNGEFMFNNEELGSIMKKIARWYDVDVIYKDEAIARETFWGTISCFNNVSDVLNMLELTKKVHFKIEGRRIIVDK